MPPQIWELVRVVGEAEDRLKVERQNMNANKQLSVAMSQLDATMEGWISQDPRLEGLVDILYVLLVTDDESEALRLDPSSPDAVRTPFDP